jgi:hypothetical protein
MHAHSSTNFRLISPLRHYTFLSLPEISFTRTRGYYTASKADGQSSTRLLRICTSCPAPDGPYWGKRSPAFAHRIAGWRE